MLSENIIVPIVKQFNQQKTKKFCEMCVMSQTIIIETICLHTHTHTHTIKKKKN